MTGDFVDHRRAVHHPVVIEHAAERAACFELRLADRITAFAGSMRFVYIHAAVFALWMLLVESDPWPKPTLIVSLEWLTSPSAGGPEPLPRLGLMGRVPLKF